MVQLQELFIVFLLAVQYFLQIPIFDFGVPGQFILLLVDPHAQLVHLDH